MKIIKIFSLFISVAAIFASGGVAFGQSNIPVEAIRVTGNEFPESYSFSNIEVNVLIENVSGADIDIERITARRKGSLVEFKSGKLPAGKALKAKVSIPLGMAAGQTAFYYDVFLQGKIKPKSSFAIRGFVDWIVDPAPLTIDLGVIQFGQKFEKIIPISIRPGKGVKLTKVDMSSPHFDVDIVQNGSAFRIRARESGEWASFDEEILLSTDSLEQPFVSTHLKGQARGAVIPSQDPVDFGLVRLGSSSEQIVRLTGIPGKKINVGRVSFEGTDLEVSKESCLPASIDCRALRLRLPTVSQRGAIFGVVKVELPDFRRELGVRYTGIAIGKDTQIRDFEEDLKIASRPEVSVSSLLKSSAQDRKPVEMATPPGTGPLITWQVANEQEVYGYEVYRSSEGATREFSRINDTIIRKIDVGDGSGSIYRWRDAGAVSGKTYWYYVGIVYLNGSKEAFTGPQKVVAK